MRVVKVPLGDRSYPILIGAGLLETLGDRCRRLALGRKCAVITDSNVARHGAAAAEESLKSAGFDCFRITVPAGEGAKSLRIARECYDLLAAHRLERNSFVVAVGGGVVGDLAGFVAATYLRGIPFVQVPTSLLAQVDSSVGGKVAVNLKAGKNLVGVFYQPQLVLCDLETLATLPPRELRSGLAEVIKYGIIYDEALFRRLERRMPRLLEVRPDDLAPVVARCCEIKAEVVGQDEREEGLRAILNFGHTIGHAIENSFGYGTFLHGEAISVGQVAAAHISADMLGLAERDVWRIRDLLAAAGLPVSLRIRKSQRRRFYDAMRHDKKVIDGELKFALAARIGQARWGQRVPDQTIEAALARCAETDE